MLNFKEFYQIIEERIAHTIDVWVADTKKKWRTELRDKAEDGKELAEDIVFEDGDTAIRVIVAAAEPLIALYNRDVSKARYFARVNRAVRLEEVLNGLPLEIGARSDSLIEESVVKILEKEILKYKR